MTQTSDTDSQGSLAKIPAPPLRVFISYKQKDADATIGIKQLLQQRGGDNIEVFVSEDEAPGIQFRQHLLKKLREAHVLIFLYTDPQSQWDWCLYETGYFDARRPPEEDDRRLYVLHERTVTPKGPFNGLNSVPIDVSGSDDKRLTDLLELLFKDSTTPSVNPYWNDGGSNDLIAAFKAPFVRREAVGDPKEYIRRLTFRVKKTEAILTALANGTIPADGEISGDPNAFELFGLSAKTWQWADVERSWRRRVPSPETQTDADPVKLWIEIVARKMLAAINDEQFDDGLPLLFSPFVETRARALFRPSLARLSVFSNTYDFEIVFVDIPPEFAAVSQGPLTTVGSLLRLAHMFRFGWIERAAKEVLDAGPNELGTVEANLMHRLVSISAESFNQGIRTEDAVLFAFEGSAFQDEARSAMDRWKTEIAPQLDSALKRGSKDAVFAALDAGSAVNWQFHAACAERYAELVRGYRKEGVGSRSGV